MPNPSNTQAPPSPLTNNLASFPSDQALNSQYSSANANLVNLGTADTRQQYLTNSNLPAMQTNYDDLARQLFEYDTGVLNPKFAGENPGTPSDAAAFGRVEASPLGMTPQSAALPANQGMWGSNPKYAYTSQVAQANSLTDLMDTLIKGMGSEFGMRTGTYKSDRLAAQDALDAVFKVMGLKIDVAKTLAQEERESRRDTEDIRQFNESIEIEREKLKKEQQDKKDKRTLEATDKALSALAETIASAEPGENLKQIVWQWINKFEPGFASAGIDASKLWDVYHKIPAPKEKPPESRSGSNPIGVIDRLIGSDELKIGTTGPRKKK